MALGKTVSYTPFNETSFGYGSNEIATAHPTEFPNSDSIVKVTIEHGSGNWDTTGHLATPSIGTAVATYHKLQEYWTVKGERDDVDAVLAAMSFFPADKAETRTWTPTALKDNLTSGTYADEEPPTIGDTDFTLRVYDGATQVSTQTVTFSVTEAVFGNQRPYWSVAPTNEDLNSTAHDAVSGGLLDLGTISHGSDTENVRVKCQFRHYGGSDYVTTGSYGAITQDENIYIGDKKPATSDNQEARFDFTGSVAEAQAFLDNVRYYGAGNQQTFDMFLTVTDGVVGSTLTKTCYFSDAVIGVSTLPDQSFIEDGDAWQDFGIVNFGNIQPDVTQFSCTVTFDATGHSGISHGYFGTGTYVDGQPLTTTRSTLAELKQDLRLLELYMEQDFNTSYTLTVDFTFSNPTLGTSYTATQQSVAVSGTPTEEVSNLNTTHSWTEDQRYDFVDSKTPQIIHPRNEQFDVIFTLSDANAGVLGRHVTSGTAFFTPSYGTSAQYKLQGTRDEVNVALQNLFFAPNPDYDDDFTIAFTVDRTSGDLTHATQATGSFTMNAVALADFSFPLTNPEINWENNVSISFNSGLQITDTADVDPNFSTYQSTYTVVARLKIDGSTFTHGVLTTDLTDEITILNDRSNEITITGRKNSVNPVLRSLKFIPDPLYDELHDFYVEYQVTRDADNVVLEGVDFSPSVRTDFKNPTITAPFVTDRQQFSWVEDTPFEFDSRFAITEKISENLDYIPANGYNSWAYSWYEVTLRGYYFDGSTGQELPEINFTTTTAPNANLTVSGIGTVSNPLTLQGSKSEINKALATMKMIPTEPDFLGSPNTYGGFYTLATLKRLRDNFFHMNQEGAISSFNKAVDTSEYRTTWLNVKYTEDIQNQSIFAHIDDFIQDGAGDLFDATYDVTIELANEVTGKFVPYVEEGYLEDGVSIFVSDYAVRLVGSKAEVNASIKDIIFTPYADVADNVDIIYTQKRTVNNTLVTHADAVTVATMTGIDTPEYVMGTATGNLQFFVQDEFILGLNLKEHTELLSRNTIAPDRRADPLGHTTLVPRLISENVNMQYDAPITITDTYENGGESLYKVVFDGGNLFTPKNEDLTTLGASLNITDTGWTNKTTLNNILKNGIYVTGVNEENANIPNHGQTFEVTFTVYRKDATGVETQMSGHRSLTYYFASGLSAYLNGDRIDNLSGQGTDIYWNPDDVIEFRQSNGLSRNDKELYGRMVHMDYDTGVYLHSNIALFHQITDENNNLIWAYNRFHYQEGLGYAVYSQDSQGNSDSAGNFFKLVDDYHYDYGWQSRPVQMQFRMYTKWGAVLTVNDRRTNFRTDWAADENKSLLFAQNIDPNT